MVINWRGEMVLCCHDYNSTIVIGNTKNRTIEDMWNDDILNKYRLSLSTGNRNLPLCNQCDDPDIPCKRCSMRYCLSLKRKENESCKIKNL